MLSRADAWRAPQLPGTPGRGRNSLRSFLLAAILGAASLPCPGAEILPCSRAATLLYTAAQPREPAALTPGPPAWVLHIPQDPDHYIGVGKGDKRAHPDDYRDVARSAALAQISREISVRIRSENLSAAREDGAGREESYGQRIRATSENNLSGYELTDSYETPEAYWTLYTLDKEFFRRIGEDRQRDLALAVEAASAAMDSAIVTHRLPDVLRILARIRARIRGRICGRYDSAATDFPGIRDGDIPARLGAFEARVESALDGVGLGVQPPEWVWSGKEPRTGTVQVFPIDRNGKRGYGKLDLIVADQTVGHAPCAIATDAEGNLDPRRLMTECALDPGTWRVTWKLPERSVETRVRAEVKPQDIAYRVRTEIPGLEGEAAWLQGELSGMGSPYVRFVPARTCSPMEKSPPVWEIELESMALDSLDGMYFATLAGSLDRGGMRKPMCGKAGHADPIRARRLAVRDIAMEIEKRVTSELPAISITVSTKP